MMWWSVTPSTSTPADSSCALAARRSATESTRSAMWLTQAGVLGEGRAAVSSPRSKKAMYEPSRIWKKMWT
jgi:hypothetical protein